MANHLTIGVYTNGQWKHNVVREEDLESHIEYNKFWRPGRVFYVDGKRVWNGCIKPEFLQRYDDIEANVRLNILKDINMSRDTRPYQ